MHMMLNLWRQIRYWDKTSRFALGMALALFVALSLLSLMGIEALQTPLLIGLIGLLLAMQAIVMWGNRHMITPYTQAQQAYLQENFAAARDHLLAYIDEFEQQGKRPPIDTLVLLGNTYRQLADLDASLEVLQQAIVRKSQYHFTLYGYGRTLLVMGDYVQAADYMQQALALGAPAGIQTDIVHAYFRANQPANAVKILEQFQQQAIVVEPYRQLMMDWVAHQYQQRPFDLRDYPQDAIAFWHAEAQRYAATSYGKILSGDIQAMHKHNDGTHQITAES